MNRSPHERLKEFHKYGELICNEAISISAFSYACFNYIGCGPGKYSCLYQSSVIPCRGCLFWSGYGMKDWEIENIRTMLSIMICSIKKD